ncbi:MAG: ATP-binding cassette domain-containing protein [Planctomycetota bacterium]|nr:ATP-binding cassette domain-containing protein [Planctomycetota bacterium]
MKFGIGKRGGDRVLQAEGISKSYDDRALFEDLSLIAWKGDRIGIVGPNGSGKSTLIKMLTGKIEPDTGWVSLGRDVEVGYYDQNRVDLNPSRTVLEEVWSVTPDATVTEIRTYLGAFLFSGDEAESQIGHLSGGEQSRVALAKLVRRPLNLLVLDEPTNHLDITSIVWLQGFLKRFSGTLIFVTHDRMFLQDIADRIVEVDRGRVFDWTCDYQTFLKRRDQLLAAESVEQAQFDKKLAEEERWIRQGVKARRTRNEGRVRALKEMREERQQRRRKVGTAKMFLQEAERSGQIVARLEGVTHSFGGEPVIRDFTTTVFRNDRIGIIGPNGAGKSTLLRILLGQLVPTEGKVRQGTNLAVGYFDQLRNQLEEDKSARENISDGTDFLMINDQKRHIMGFLQDFLFSPERAHTLVKFLSGGERNRLLLAKMMSKPANILVLDEPTNDLDAETLELLEEMLPNFHGTVLLVSHDRAFLNNVVSSTIVFEGNGEIGEYDGGYDDWLRTKEQRETIARDAASFEKPVASVGSSFGSTAVSVKSKKLSFKDQRELDELPERIASLEKRQKTLHAEMAAPGFYQSGGDRITKAATELAQIEDDLAECFQRWESLDGT